MDFTEEYAQFFTATILEWKMLLKPDKYKQIITASLSYMVENKRLKVYGFVIMSNHIHIIWQSLAGYSREVNQLSFMKFTAQMIIKELRNNHPQVLEHFRVNLKDRKYQIWERNPLSIELRQREVFHQKLTYIHNNPMKAGLCEFPETYKYSSAKYYICNQDEWGFITNISE
jgi:putative transposase